MAYQYGILVSALIDRYSPPLLNKNNDRWKGGGALRVKISRGAPLEVQNGTQQDLNKMIDLVNQQDLNKIVDMVEFAENGGKTAAHTYWLSKRECPPPTNQHHQHHPPGLYPTRHHFVTEMCTCAQISVTKLCIVGYLSDVLWDLWDGYCWNNPPFITFLSTHGN